MKNFNFKKLLPHLIAIAVFLLVAVIFCKPALESGVVMQQGDFTQAEAMKHQSEIYKEQHGVYPLWVTSMFCGMPAYNLIFDGVWSPFGYADKILQLYLPKPLNFFFLCCICFYFLCMCLRIRPYVAILGSLAFAYCSFNPILAVAGHDTELLALAYAPALIGAVILIFDKKYISGFILTALFATLHLMQNHQQISYYTFMIIVVAGIFYLVKWIKEKDTKHIAKVIPLTIGAALIGICVNAVILFPVMDYAKYSKRGGQLAMDNKIDSKTNHIEKDKTVGLTREYAFQWSYGRLESLSLLFPGITGYGSYYSQRDDDYNMFPKLDENSNVSTYLTDKLNVPQAQADNITANLSQSIYWGEKPFTSGSVYLGASICFLFILGMFLLDGKHKWWIFTASILGIILAMGKNLPGINNLFFAYLPLYNKFRTPEMALVIPQIVFPILAVLTVDKLVDADYNYTAGLKSLKFSAITAAVIFVIAGLLYFGLDYSKENKERTAAVNAAFATPDSSLYNKMQQINQKYEPMVDNQVYENFLEQSKGDTKIPRELLTALHKDRQSFFGGDILRSLLFVSLTIGLIALYMYKKINTTILLIGLPLLILFDLVPFGMNYVNDKSFESADKYQANEFPLTDADKQILQDKDPNYRVFNLSVGDPFQDAKTSYYHKSIGGYHPAKLGIYDDLLTYQLSGQPNPDVLNMLNAKYIIQKNQQGNGTIVIPNPSALGNCWFVKGVKFVETPTEEMKALNNFNPADTAVVNSEYKNIITGFAPADSSSTIKQTSFDNEDIKYESNSNTANVAVFSEIFYKDWKAYIDGNETPIAKANYVLRALVVPAGKHTIEFKFQPKIYTISCTVSLIAIWLLTAMLVWLVYHTFIQKKKE